MRLSLLLFSAILMAGCGYVGDPLPPALNLAKRITDVRAVEYGDRVVVEFTIPQRTTDDLPLRRFSEVDLRIGPGADPFSIHGWSAEAKKVPVKADAPGMVEASIPVQEWLNRDVVIAVRMINTRGKASEWSNLAVLHVEPPLAAPAGLKAEPDPGGVKLSWTSPNAKFRVYRRNAGDTSAPGVIATPDAPSFVDPATELGKRYEYMVQAVDRNAESELTAAVAITPRDVFPPVAPTGLGAGSGIGSIELVWDRNTESDLKGYRVYRAAEGRDFERVAELVEAPAYSDKQVETGKKYRYAVSAVDLTGNEGPRSAPVEATAP